MTRNTQYVAVRVMTREDFTHDGWEGKNTEEGYVLTHDRFGDVLHIQHDSDGDVLITDFAVRQHDKDVYAVVQEVYDCCSAPVRLVQDDGSLILHPEAERRMVHLSTPRRVEYC